jgi:hypothetical protein
MKKAFIILLILYIAGCVKNNEIVEPEEEVDTEELLARTKDYFVDNIGANLPGINTTNEHNEVSDYEWSSSSATHIVFNGSVASVTGLGATWINSVLQITAAGTYVISGISTQAQILVQPTNSDLVKIVLNGVTLTNSGSVINIQKSLKTVIIANAGTTNSLTDTPNYTFADNEDEPDATIFSKKDLSFGGTGTIKISSNYKDAIRSKEGLIINDGNFLITSVEDGIKGKDYLVINNATIDITAGDDGIVASNDSDRALGYLRIENGEVRISSVDKAIKAETGLIVNGGKINVTKSYEALEGMGILINGGELDLTASDDGINAKDGNSYSATVARNTDHQEVFIKFSGGTVQVNANGDGIDSNGSIYQNGGLVLINGPTANMDGPIDYDNTYRISGGIIIATGSSRMAQIPGNSSTQKSLLVNFSSSQPANRIFSIKNSHGKEIITYQPSKSYQSVAFSAPDLVAGSYTFSIGGSSTGINSKGLYSGGAYSEGTETGFSLSAAITITLTIR